MIPMSTYGVGIDIRISVVFKNAAGADTDPTLVTLLVRKPNGDRLSEAYNPGNITKASIGNYFFDARVDQPGYWHYRWEGDGTVEAVQEQTFYAKLDHAL